MKFRIIIAVLTAGLLSLCASAAGAGKWGETPAGMPYVQYTGAFSADDASADPYFLLGNYRLNLFTHASGTYQLMSGERVWSRYNADPNHPGYGRSRASVKIEDKSYELVGETDVTASEGYTVTSGVGFTRYDYILDKGIKCSRMLSVMPSDKVNGGEPAFLLTVTFRNTSNVPLKVTYEEVMLPCLVPVNEQELPQTERSHKYPYTTNIAFRTVTATFNPSAQKYVRWTEEGEPAIFEKSPMPMFMYSPDAFLRVLDSGLYAVMDDVKIRPGHTRTFKVVIGLVDGDIKSRSEEMLKKAEDGQFGAFASMWKSVLPDLKGEKDNFRRREMYWNAHMLEASAVYDRYFDETFIPAGGEVSYRLGRKTSMADQMHSILPLCYTDPALAKSALRFVMKHVDSFGRISDGSLGSGHVLPASAEQFELQFGLLHAVSEYLRITGDSAFLEEFFEVKTSGKSVYTSPAIILENCFLYLRDECMADKGGRYGAMLSAVFPNFISQMRTSGKIAPTLLRAMESFYSSQQEVSTADLSAKDNGELSYLICVDSVPVSVKRACLDLLYDRQGEAVDFATESRFLIGALSFDRIEASGISRRLSFSRLGEMSQDNWTGDWTAPSVFDPAAKAGYVYSSAPHAWSLYCYYKMLE